MRIGIIARDDADEAWRVAHERFPVDRTGQVAHAMAMRVSDSHWHHQLARRSGTATPPTELGTEPEPYWLGPFENYQSFCPYLVGSHDRVAAEVARYLERGTEVFVLDIPPDPEDLGHAGEVFTRATGAVRA